MCSLELIENISHAIKLNSIEILTDTFFLIGDLHLCQGSMEKAIFSYFHMVRLLFFLIRRNN